MFQPLTDEEGRAYIQAEGETLLTIIVLWLNDLKRKIVFFMCVLSLK